MNRTFLAFLSGLFVLAACTGKESPVRQEFVSDGSYNADFVLAISDAYRQFEENDELPAKINVQGLTYTKAKYVAAAGLLLEKIASEPDTWTLVDVEIPKCSAGDVDQNNTFFPDSISTEQVRWMYSKMTAYAESHYGLFPNYVTFPEKYIESDGTEHDSKLTFNNAAVIFARVIDCFVRTSSLPDKVSSWQSDFLRKTSNCDTESAVVLSAAKAALAESGPGLRERAEALFRYSIDEWEWINYSNTRKGSVKTIEDKSGNCCDLSHALIAMCRASGIPARYMHGQCQFSSGTIGHVFVEIYVDGAWYICDPSNDANTFGHHNWSHMNTFNGRCKTLPF